MTLKTTLPPPICLPPCGSNPLGAQRKPVVQVSRSSVSRVNKVTGSKLKGTFFYP